ncbi:MAG: N-acetyltransferase [Alphaproteobacteria bacterium]|nr:N-acetyltransferase [Alphaproteobacteria bacterium]
MPEHLNPLGQPIGLPLPGWTARPRPPGTAMTGVHCRLEPLDAARHAEALFEANGRDRDGRNWTYLAVGPFGEFAAYRDWVASVAKSQDPLFFAIVARAGERAVGVASYLRIDPAIGSIEVGNINYSPLAQRTPIASEAMFLMMRRVFDELGYRRYEWKCDSLNAPSRRAALRYGFRYEGLFRQATIYKGRNRDTIWFAMLDREWPYLKRAYERWLAPDNFTPDGQQKMALGELTIAALVDCDRGAAAILEAGSPGAATP